MQSMFVTHAFRVKQEEAAQQAKATDKDKEDGDKGKKKTKK